MNWLVENSETAILMFIVLSILVIVNKIVKCKHRKKKRGVKVGNPSYRTAFIREHPGVRRIGKRGYWYRCARCGKWCGRPGNDRVYIPDNQKMEVDHIRPWSMGGTDDVWNLQAMCKPCNRSKSANPTIRDRFKIAANTVAHPVDGLVKTPIKKVMRKTGIQRRK